MSSERTSLLKGSNGNGLDRHDRERNGASASPPPSYGAVNPHGHHNLAGLPAWRFRLACLSVWSATFLAAFDGTVVATLLSDIGSAFEAFHLASWLGTAYLLSLCCFTPVYGRLADAIGRRNAQLVALGFFTVGTVFCATAPSMYALIAARCLAGMGGGGLSSVGSILLSDLVDLRHRGIYQGYANILFGLGASLGGPVGGWASDHFGWRVAFGAQVPLLFISVALIIIFIPADLGGSRSVEGGRSSPTPSLSVRQKLMRIDYAGALLLATAVGALLLGFSLRTAARKPDGTEYSWTDPTIAGLLALFVVATLAFLAVEEWYALEPILPLDLMKRRTPASVAVSNLTMAMAIFSLLYNVPLYFTAVRLQSSSVAGIRLLPYTVLIGAGSLAVGWFMRRTGRYYPAMLGSGLLIVLSTGMMLWWDEHSPEWLTWVAQSPSGFGYAGALTSTLVALMHNVQKEGRGEIAVATSMTYMFRTIGQVLGVAIGSALLQGTLQVDLAQHIADPELVEHIRRSTAIIPALPPAIREIAIKAYSHGLHRAAVVNFALAIVTTLAMAAAEDEDMPESEADVNVDTHMD